MTSWKDYQKDAILFLEAGFIAVNQSDEDAAVKLFKASELLKAELPLAKVGVGYLHLHKLELKQAIAAFEEVLAKDPNNEMGKVLLGIALGLVPVLADKGEKILEQVGKSSRDPLIKELSHQGIDFVEKFIKKPITPIEASRKKKQK